MAMTQNSETPGVLRPFIWVAYVVALVLTLLPLVDRALQWRSVQPGSAAWRFGAVGSLGEVVLIPIFGLFLIFVIAHLQGNTIVQRTLEIITGITALLLAIAIGLFALDGLQMRGAVADSMPRFDIVAVRALAGLFVALFFLIALPITSLRARRQAPRGGRRAPEPAGRSGKLQDSLVRPA